jgi:amylosucrase
MQKPTASSAASTQVAYRIRSGVQHLITLRQTLPSLHAAVATEVRAGRSRGVAIFDRHHPAGHLVQVYNLSDTDQFVDTNELGGLYGTVHDHITGHTFDIGAGMPLAPYEVRWLTRG